MLGIFAEQSAVLIVAIVLTFCRNIKDFGFPGLGGWGLGVFPADCGEHTRKRNERVLSYVWAWDMSRGLAFWMDGGVNSSVMVHWIFV